MRRSCITTPAPLGRCPEPRGVARRRGSAACIAIFPIKGVFSCVFCSLAYRA
jgi:hypothetical protein